MKETKPQFIISASVSENAHRLHKKFKDKAINFSRLVDQLILQTAKKKNIE